MKKCSKLLTPLTSLISTDPKLDWTDKHKKAFKAIKNFISSETLLSYPAFTKPFDIHKDASDFQLGAVISQNKKRIAFYSKKWNPAQTWYTTTEKELLAIVEMLNNSKTYYSDKNPRLQRPQKFNI